MTERISPLTNEERETIISFDETTALAHIFTYSKRWQKHLETRLELKPLSDNGFGGRDYEIPKSRISLPRVPKKLSPEQRELLAERLRKARVKKSPN